MSLSSFLFLVIDGTNAKITFKTSKNRFDLSELDVALPQNSRIFCCQIGTKKVVSIHQFGIVKLLFFQSKFKVLFADALTRQGDVDFDKSIGTARFLFGRSQFQEKNIAASAVAPQRSQG